MVSSTQEMSSKHEGICKGCALGKNTKKPFPISKGLLDLIHSEIYGPMSSPSLSGCLYYDHSRKSWIKDFKALIENQTWIKRELPQEVEELSYEIPDSEVQREDEEFVTQILDLPEVPESPPEELLEAPPSKRRLARYQETVQEAKKHKASPKTLRPQKYSGLTSQLVNTESSTYKEATSQQVVYNLILILVLYVDDLFLTGEEQLIAQCKRELTFEFEMKDLGLMHYFLGLEVW